MNSVGMPYSLENTSRVSACPTENERQLFTEWITRPSAWYSSQ